MIVLSFAVIIVLSLLQLSGCKVDAVDLKGQYSDRLRELVYTCPRSCHCPSDDSVNCSGSRLDEFPQVISNKVLYLHLQENSISEIENKSFEACPYIEGLYLRDNNLGDDSISRGSLSELSALRHLSLADNNFTRIPEDLPDSLVILSMEGNSISTIDDVRLARMAKLKNLNLHDNKITSAELSKGAFMQLKSLTEVKLRNNLLSAIPRLPHNVEWVNLSKNRISHIRNGIFRKKKNLLSLELQSNLLSDEGISSRAFSGLSGLRYLTLSTNKLRKVPVRLPRSLEILYIQKNELQHIPDVSFMGLKKLTHLLLHDNNLNSTSFSESVFLPLKRLKILHIYGNKLDHIPRMLPPRLEVLMLMSNNIRYLRRKTMLRMKKIKELGLQNNRLSNKGLEKGALRSLCSLKNIYLSSNILTALPTLPRSVEIVLLSNNRIVRLPHNSVSRLKRVRELFLDGNRITGIGDVFANLTTLKKLDLSYNSLRHIPSQLPPNLECLDLRNNQLFRIRYDAFFSAPSLRDIVLIDNDLSPDKVNETAFTALRHLRSVDINWKTSMEK